MAEHFVEPPHWGWYIVLYFFAAGLAGGCYTLSTILRARGSADDEATARLGYLVTFPLVVLGAIFLTIDLGQPLRFWHMLVDTTPGEAGLGFKYWSPISLGSWAIFAFSLFSFVSLVEVLHGRRTLPLWFTTLGSLVALFLASYTGVVLSVSNQPVWSDSWAIGGLFVASALSASAALMAWLAHARGGTPSSEQRLHAADRPFALLELILIVVFFSTLSAAGTLGRALNGTWLVLWVLVLLSLIPPLFRLGGGRAAVAGGGEAAVASSGASSVLFALIVIIGVLLMRIAVIFSAQS
jgi:polysulfide reductase chain C